MVPVAAYRLPSQRLAQMGGTMKKAIAALALFAFCSVVSQSAWAKPKSKPSSRSDFGLSRLGVEAGLVDPEAVGSTIGFGAFADLGTIARNVRLSTHLGYWSKSEEGFGVEASVRDISLVTRAKYMFRVSSPKVQPYVGGGLGLHFYNTEVDVPGFGSAEDSSTKLGLDLGGGLSTPLSPKTNLFGELWYTAADLDQVAMKAGVSFQLSR